VNLLIGDIENQVSIDEIVSKTKVIISAAGPYLKIGTPIVDACVRFGVDYCDVTGEVAWVKTMIDKYQTEAVKKGVFLVPFCGFDSVPSDLGTLICVEHIKQKYGENTSWTKLYVNKLSLGASTGTIDTMMNLIESGHFKVPSHILDPHPEIYDPRDTDQYMLHYDSIQKKWTVPFPMQGINSRVVRRSAALMKKKYGFNDNYGYSETAVTSSVLSAFFITVMMFIMMTILHIRFTRNLVKKYLLTKGDGPSENKRRGAQFDIVVIGQSSESGTRIGVEIHGDSDVYTKTAVMVVESALCLLQQRKNLPYCEGMHAGFLTPSSCFGRHLLERIQKRGITFKVVDKH